MKFNLLLLLLTTLTAVVLSQSQIFGPVTIQLFRRDLFWGLNGTEVVLYPGGVRPIIWTIIPPNDENGSLIRSPDGEFVQYNDDNKPLFIANDGGSSWLFEPNNAPIDILVPRLICSKQHPDMCATAVETNSGWVVKAERRQLLPPSPSQLWIVHRAF